MAKKKGGSAQIVTKGMVMTPVRVFDNDITGDPPDLAMYPEPKEVGSTHLKVQRPGGAGTGPSINSVTVKKGKGK